jgi:hypothetical protein
VWHAKLFGRLANRRPAENFEKVHVGQLNLGVHPISAQAGGQGDRAFDQWPADAGTTVPAQHCQPVSLPQPVSDRVQPHASGGYTVDEAEDVNRCRIVVVGVAIRFGEQLLLTDEDLAPDVTVQRQLRRILDRVAIENTAAFTR